jgi:hypothetical protein
VSGELNAEASFFQQGGIFSQGGKIPDLGGGITVIIMPGEYFAGSHEDLFDVAFAAHFEDEATAGRRLW